MDKRFFLIVLVTLFFQQIAIAGLTYEGSTTIGENIMPELTKAFEAKKKIRFEFIGGLGSGKGFKAVMEGKASIGGVSRGLTSEEKEQKPYYRIIGYDAIAIFINQKNPIENLSKEEIKGIFTGKITNWKDVGGLDAPILVVTEIKTGERATIKEFKETALDGAEFGPTMEIDKPHDCVRYVAEDENAVTDASIAFKELGTKAVSLNGIQPSSSNVRSGAYLLSRPLILVSKGLPKDELKEFFDFVFSEEGQAIIGKKFVPVK